MTVDERRDVHGARADQFPAGLRVLAVDDDTTCLKLLEVHLRTLQYNVTTTNQAILALNLLRENKDKFDLVISDVHMPDMDGFKLLELVGLEMDLPVIMLSGNSDPKVVMQGITHGACDYLLKPVRADVLKNIWQHVYRRRRFDALSSSSENHRDDMDRQQHGNSESGQHCGASLRHTGRKRKDQDEDDEGEEMEENMNENEDSSTQKKPRVVWSVELHRKFVTAVNQLGIEKAMPKRILDLMNVEKLTRENVASHLQKYRLYLKRISTVANQQANMVAALGGKDSQFLPMGSLDGARSYHSFPASAQLTTLASFQQGGMLGRLNSANNQALYGLGSSGMIQLGARAHNNNINNPPTIHDMGNFPHISFSSGAQQGNLIQGTPIPLERKLLIESAGNSTITQSNHYISTGNNFQILQVQQQKQNNVFGSVPSERPTSSINPDIFDATTAVSSDPPDLGRCNETWGAAAPIAGYPSNMLSHGANFNRDNGMNACAGDNLSAVVLSANRSRTKPPSSSASMGRDAQCPNQCPINKFDSNILPPCENDDAMCGATRTDQPMQQNFRYCSSNAMLDMVIDDVGLGNGSSSSSMMESGKLQGAFNSGGYNAFDELMTAIVKREREDILMDGDVGCDLFSLETCM